MEEYLFHQSLELISGLRANLSKSISFGLNLDYDFLQATASFLSCNFGLILFVFLGIPIGVNLRRKEYWALIVSKLRRRLTVWHNRFFYIRVRAILLSFVLSNILMFLFFFYKDPKVIVNKIIRIQITFL